LGCEVWDWPAFRGRGVPLGCRAYGAPLELMVVDLGMSPLCESFVPAERLEWMAPLTLSTCEPTRALAGAAPRVHPPEETSMSTATSPATRPRGSSMRDVETIRAGLELGESELASNDG
jgi:hypothetical protein